MYGATTVQGLTAASRPEATRRAYPPVAAVREVVKRAGATRPNIRSVGEPNRGSNPSGAPPCRIYRPSPSAMQAGRRKARAWVLEFEYSGRRWIEPLMGWTATDDPFDQVRLTFPTLAAAVAYAEREELAYQVIGPPVRRGGRNSYREMSAETQIRSDGTGHAGWASAPGIAPSAPGSDETQTKGMEVLS